MQILYKVSIVCDNSYINWYFFTDMLNGRLLEEKTEQVQQTIAMNYCFEKHHP